MISETVTQAPPSNNRQSDFAQALMAKGPAAHRCAQIKLGLWRAFAVEVSRRI
jgi:hypothetical protein